MTGSLTMNTGTTLRTQASTPRGCPAAPVTRVAVVTCRVADAASRAQAGNRGRARMHGKGVSRGREQDARAPACPCPPPFPRPRSSRAWRHGRDRPERQVPGARDAAR
jgi:hypothetical protein